MTAVQDMMEAVCQAPLNHGEIQFKRLTHLELRSFFSRIEVGKPIAYVHLNLGAYLLISEQILWLG